uniref:Uncharacterized protein n=1 Tax=Heterorhabditis bacteriophora TaxID=37862 RepID=A0A1I7W8Z8_HETBA
MHPGLYAYDEANNNANTVNSIEPNELLHCIGFADLTTTFSLCSTQGAELVLLCLTSQEAISSFDAIVVLDESTQERNCQCDAR